MAELNIDTFGEIMDDFIEKNHIQMLIDIQKGRTNRRSRTTRSWAAWYSSTFCCQR